MKQYLKLLPLLFIVPCYGQQPAPEIKQEPAITKDMVTGIVEHADQRKAEIDAVVKLVDTTIDIKMIEFKKLLTELNEHKRQYDNHEKRLNAAMLDILKSLNAVQSRTNTLYPDLVDKFNSLLPKAS